MTLTFVFWLLHWTTFPFISFSTLCPLFGWSTLRPCRVSCAYFPIHRLLFGRHFGISLWRVSSFTIESKHQALIVLGTNLFVPATSSALDTDKGADSRECLHLTAWTINTTFTPEMMFAIRDDVEMIPGRIQYVKVIVTINEYEHISYCQIKMIYVDNLLLNEHHLCKLKQLHSTITSDQYFRWNTIPHNDPTFRIGAYPSSSGFQYCPS